MVDFPVIISGAGPAGLAAAALLAQEGVKVAVIAPTQTAPDPRTTALMQPAMQLLKYIGIWPGVIATHCAPLRRLHLIDDTGHLVSAPKIEFAAEELGLEEFGWNVPLALLIPTLHQRATALGVTFIEGKCTSVSAGESAITLTTETYQNLSTELVLAADGATSPLRRALGFATQTRKFDQAALVTTFDHTASHEFTSTEWHKQDGPLTTVPLPGNRSALVWMAKPARIEALSQLSSQELCTEIQLENHGALGRVSNPSPTKSFPMQLQRATILAKSRCFLIGEAAHALPPIGAQGLNLSLRDVATAADVIVGASDPGTPALCAEYDRLRRADIGPRLEVTGLLNASLLSEFPAMHLARAASLSAVAKFPPLRHLALRQGLGTAATLPFAMRA